MPTPANLRMAVCRWHVIAPTPSTANAYEGQVRDDLAASISGNVKGGPDFQTESHATNPAQTEWDGTFIVWATNTNLVKAGQDLRDRAQTWQGVSAFTVEGFTGPAEAVSGSTMNWTTSLGILAL